MNLPARYPPIAFALVAVLPAVLALLAFLQYRWIGEVSQAERARLQRSLQSATQQFREEFNGTLQRLGTNFDVNPPPSMDGAWDRYIERFENWFADDQAAPLLAGIYLRLREEGEGSRILRLNPAAHRWEPGELEPGLAPLEAILSLEVPGRPGPPGPMHFPGWRIFPREYAMARILPATAFGTGDPHLPPEARGHLILSIDRDYLWNDFVPDVIRRCFGKEEAFACDVAVAGQGGNGPILFRSDPRLDISFLAGSDVRTGIFRARMEQPVFPGGPARSIAAPGMRSPGSREAAGRGFFDGVRRLPVVLASEEQNWDLFVRYHTGSLDGIVTRSRYRNIAVSFGVLLVIAVGMAVLLLAERRARHLAQMQMEFVARVSHDLRTPLAVLSAAGDNLAEGIVPSQGPRVREYGALIRSESRKLTAMVERILQFAGMQSDRSDLRLEVTGVADAIDSILVEAKPLMEERGIHVERDIPPGLPPVRADRSMLGKVLHNLLDNAVKYAGESGWLAIRATVEWRHGEEVTISIEDRGAGIPPEELPFIFDPFYRGKNALDARAAGSGLGLSIVREGMLAMGGRATATSTVGRGTSIHLHFPAVIARENAGGSGIHAT